MKYRQMLRKSNSQLNKEMDLKKFLVRQRLQTTAVLALLTGRQSFIVDKMCQMNLRQSSNFEDTTESGELSDW